jgi:hypothetical protein
VLVSPSLARKGNVIETLHLDGSPATVSAPFQGQNLVWFSDGERFTTKLVSFRWIYAKDGTLEETLQPSTLEVAGGFKDYYWTLSNFYKVGNGGKPVANFFGDAQTAVPVTDSPLSARRTAPRGDAIDEGRGSSG